MTVPRILLTFALCSLLLLPGCAAKKDGGKTGAGGSVCVDVNGLPITGGTGKPLKKGETCDWVLATLDGKPPCRTEDGFVIYDELGRPFPDDSFCPQAREMLKKQ